MFEYMFYFTLLQSLVFKINILYFNYLSIKALEDAITNNFFAAISSKGIRYAFLLQNSFVPKCKVSACTDPNTNILTLAIL
ncbi:hypothetical protein BpHYR1_027311 [Brachionus plicatilis]|uniref:Uncharacterized protein n=1 Tax=Brachionus plicatilis TaxID=10195 RepID=A0A3M7PRV4_BRAPC|nr:hypothetical protein BpHYR1_027311 [Brachionus plicatilis]